MRPGRRWLLLLLAAAAAYLVWPAGSAGADESEPLLFLGISRSTTIDKLASQMVVETLKERGENLLPTANLSDTERRCRRAQCLAPLASQRKAALLLDGDVQQVGGNRTLRVVMHLYASRQRQQQELENLCADCDDTKLGIVLSNTTADLLAQYHKGAQAMDQLAALLDATPAGLQDRSQTAAADASQAQTAQAAPPTQSSDAAQGAPPPTAQAPTPPTATPPPGPLAQGSTLPATPGAYPTPLPPAPVLSGNEPLTSGRTTTQKPGRSVQRKAIAGVLGALGFGTLVGSLVLNILDMHIASNHSYNPAGSPCIDPQYAGQYCVYSTIRLWAPGYAVGGLLVGGMILTLALPEHGR